MAVKAPSRPAGREGGGRVGEVRETQPLNRPPVPTTGRTKQKWPVAPEKYNNYATNSIAFHRDNCDTPNGCSLPAVLILPMNSLLANLKLQSCISVSRRVLHTSTYAQLAVSVAGPSFGCTFPNALGFPRGAHRHYLTNLVPPCCRFGLRVQRKLLWIQRLGWRLCSACIFCLFHGGETPGW